MRLIDCFAPVLAYTSRVKAELGNTQPAFDPIRQNIDHFLDQARKSADAAGLSLEDFNQARFAVCAWIDECFLTSDWKARDQWELQQLQLVHYETTNAGEEFFTWLHQLLSSPESRGILEVYGACLALGFNGRYYPIRKQLTLEEIGKEVMQKAVEGIDNPFNSEEMKFFPQGYLKKIEAPRKPIHWMIVPFWFLMIGLSATMVGGLFFGLNHYLNQIVDLYFKSGM